MRPHLIPPGPHCDGWQLWALDENSLPRLCIGTGATKQDAIGAGVREALILLGELTRQFETARAYEDLHRVAALVVAGERDLVDLADACRVLEERKYSDE